MQTTRAETGSRARYPDRVVTIVVVASVILAALSLLWLAGETRYRGCIERVSARYAPIAVSAYNGQQTGPLKVAYDAERAKALEGCGRLPF